MAITEGVATSRPSFFDAVTHALQEFKTDLALGDESSFRREVARIVNPATVTATHVFVGLSCDDHRIEIYPGEFVTRLRTSSTLTQYSYYYENRTGQRLLVMGALPIYANNGKLLSADAVLHTVERFVIAKANQSVILPQVMSPDTHPLESVIRLILPEDLPNRYPGFSGEIGSLYYLMHTGPRSLNELIKSLHDEIQADIANSKDPVSYHKVLENNIIMVAHNNTDRYLSMLDDHRWKFYDVGFEVDLWVGDNLHLLRLANRFASAEAAYRLTNLAMITDRAASERILDWLEDQIKKDHFNSRDVALELTEIGHAIRNKMTFWHRVRNFRKSEEQLILSAALNAGQVEFRNDQRVDITNMAKKWPNLTVCVTKHAIELMK